MMNSKPRPIDFFVHEYRVKVDPAPINLMGIEITNMETGIVIGRIKEHNKENNEVKIGLSSPIPFSMLIQQNVRLEDIVPIYFA